MNAASPVRRIALVAAAAAFASCARDTGVHRQPPEGRDIGPALWRYFEPLAAGDREDPLLERVKQLAQREQGKVQETRPSKTPLARAGEQGAAPSPDLPETEEGKTDSVPESVPSPAGPPPLRLAAGDEVDIVVGGRPEFSGVVRVREDGEVALPTTGDLIPAAGLTPRELARAVSQGLHPRYLRAEPEVSVSLRSSPRLVYYVFGAVRQPRMYRMPPGGVTVLDAVLAASRLPTASEDGAAAGGFEPVPGAVYERVYVVNSIVSPGGGSEEVNVKIVDVASAMRGGPDPREVVPPGSRLIVPTRSGRFSEAEIRRGLPPESLAPSEAASSGQRSRPDRAVAPGGGGAR